MSRPHVVIVGGGLAGLTAESTRQGAESIAQRRFAMSGSLLDLADRNRLNLLRAAEARENAALGIAGQAAGAARDIARYSSGNSYAASEDMWSNGKAPTSRTRY